MVLLEFCGSYESLGCFPGSAAGFAGGGLLAHGGPSPPHSADTWKLGIVESRTGIMVRRRTVQTRNFLTFGALNCSKLLPGYREKHASDFIRV